MIIIPNAKPNTLTVSMVPDISCCKREFDPTFPIQLNGIIRQDEYQQSIETINQAFGSRLILLIVYILFVLCLLLSIILIIVGAITASNSSSKKINAIAAVGIALFIVSFILLVVSLCVVREVQKSRLRKAVANESGKYCARKPTPVFLRLKISRVAIGGGRRRGSKLVYHLIIDIGHNGQQNATNVPYGSNQVYPYPPPSAPQYNAQPAAAFCSQCGIARQNPLMKFCPSCGQAFNN
ncbi:unnamed protein product [Adineta ricciae]|uniref:Uncharacterized protein n=1 Tax=Adineta ricciae TaxID=249248 RepID=A0A816DLW3_ADIRI|nr:unnamed protein product [Adineta ricciae]CAF1638873.1 unnamed protein product [Adineta ricciae]